MRPERPPLVLLHGWGMHGGVFAPLATSLHHHGWEVHTPDLPGHGRNVGHSFHDLDSLCRSVAEQLPPRCVLGGWSLGGLVALQLAATLAPRIAGLLLLHTTPRFAAAHDWSHGMDPPTLAAFGAALDGSPGATFERFLALQVRGDAAPRETLRWLRAVTAEGGRPAVATLAAGLEVLARTDLRDSLRHIQQPCLVVGSQDDALTPPGASRWLAAQLPSARLELLDGTGHTGALRPAADIAALITTTLAGQPAGVAA